MEKVVAMPGMGGSWAWLIADGEFMGFVSVRRKHPDLKENSMDK